MGTRTGRVKRVTVTVGDLIAAVFDVVGDRVDSVVDLLRYEDMRKRSPLIIDGALDPRAKDQKFS